MLIKAIPKEGSQMYMKASNLTPASVGAPPHFNHSTFYKSRTRPAYFNCNKPFAFELAENGSPNPHIQWYIRYWMHIAQCSYISGIHQSNVSTNAKMRSAKSIENLQKNLI